MEALGINAGYLVMQILGVTILTLAMKGLLTGPITKTLEERKRRIAEGLENSRKAEVALKNAESDAQKILDEARKGAARIRSEATASSEVALKNAEKEASEAARQILAKADKDAAERRNQALGDLRGQISSLAIAAANKIVGESLDEKRQHALINDFFAKVPATVSSVKGSVAEVISAVPLTSAEQAEAKRNISATTVTFRVDPSILGGIIVRVGDQVVDNSVASQMNGLRDSIK